MDTVLVQERSKIPNTDKIKSQTSSSVFLCINPVSREGSERPGKEETVTESNLLFWLLQTPRPRRQGSKTTRLLPQAGGQQPQPETRVNRAAGNTLLSVPSAGHSRYRSPGTAADQLRPARPTLPAPPGPPERGPRPRGAERAGAAKRPDRGPSAAFASSPEPGLRAAGRSPVHPQLLPSSRGGTPGDGPPDVALPREEPTAREGNNRDGPGNWKGALRPAAAAAAAAGEGCCFPHTGGSAEAAAAILNPSDSHIHTAPPASLRRRPLFTTTPSLPSPLHPHLFRASLRVLPLSGTHVNAHASLPPPHPAPSTTDTPPERARADCVGLESPAPRDADAVPRPPPLASARTPSGRPTAPAPCPPPLRSPARPGACACAPVASLLRARSLSPPHPHTDTHAHTDARARAHTHTHTHSQLRR
ncbi:transcription initiation factor TFIID subunit 4 [Mus musculus]|uniref:transcription initiation factor TFIID subunit 4 n=1 Tax=Mus musculus TaxID=10090 RepID=UPI0016763C3D|nr:transcription initiation factor TFIID subunit 4 [Mus musculus]